MSACPSCLNPALRTESAHDLRCPEGFADAVSVIEDPRARRGRRHPLSLVVSLAAAAVAAGADSFVAIGQWAADLPRHLLARIGSGGRAPSESTFRRVLQRLDPDLLDPIVAAWLVARSPHGPHGPHRQRIALDGKTVRGSGSADRGAVHLVAAVDHDSGEILGQVAVGDKGGEIAALAPLLDTLDITGALVTADALHTQRGHAAYLRRRGAHYLFTCKGNQPTLHAQLAALPWKHIPIDVVTCNKAHGRLEQRTLQATTVGTGIAFPGARIALRITRTRTLRSTRRRCPPTSTEVVYAITDMTYDQITTTDLADALRRHWSIENRVHHVRDVTFDEDRSQIRTGTAPRVMATLRNTVITLLRHGGALNIASARRALAAHPDRALNLLY